MIKYWNAFISLLILFQYPLSVIAQNRSQLSISEKAKIFQEKGNIYLNNAQYDSAYFFLKKAWENTPNKSSEHFLQINLARAAEDNKNLEEAEILYLNLKNNPSTHDSLRFVSFYNLGRLETNKKNYELALDYFQNGLELYIKHPTLAYPTKEMFYNNIGTAYLEQGNYNQALSYFLKCFPDSIEQRPSNYPFIFKNIGFLHKMLGNFDQAIHYHLKAIKGFKENPSNWGPSRVQNEIALTNYNLGTTYEQMAKNDSAHY